jgi:hypothetical protein
MNRKLLVLILFFFSVIFFGNTSLAYMGTVHAIIIEKSVKEASKIGFVLETKLGVPEGVNAILTKNGEKKRIWQWLAYGGEAEDLGKSNIFLLKDLQSRAYNHFHDPLKKWDAAGLDNNRTNFIYNNHYGRDPVSPILWGLVPGQQDFSKNTTGDWSWGEAREYYYAYLTGKDFTDNAVAASLDDREAFFADCFRAVGQMMHLLEDASVPLHTRNDVHIFPLFGTGRWTYETYTSRNWRFLDYSPDQLGDYPSAELLTDPQPDSGHTDLVPVTGLFDRNQYNQGSAMPASDAIIGLAEYSNANFLTNDTMWTYQHPALEETNYDENVWLNPETVDAEDGEQDQRIYFGKNTGEPIDHLMAAGYWYYQLYMWNKPELEYAFLVDEECFADYADKLIPRAVGYSAALLDYFFRGSIELSLPSEQHHTGVYAMTTDPDQGFTRLALNAKNTSLNNEKMTDGTIEIVVKYKLTLDDPFQSYPVPTTEEFSYIVVPESNNTRAIPSDEYVELEFELIPALPLYATDVSINLVYKGILGAETDAVVVGHKDISEPTPIDIFSNLDKVCLAGGWHDAGSPEAITLVDNNGNGIADRNEVDVYPHDLWDIYLRITSVDDPQYPSRTEEDVLIPELNAGEFKRAAYILSDDEFMLSTYRPNSLCTHSADDHQGLSAHTSLYTRTGITNQEVAGAPEDCTSLGSEPPCTIRAHPTFTPFRGVEMRDGVVFTYQNGLWGHDTSCSLDTIE